MPLTPVSNSNSNSPILTKDDFNVMGRSYFPNIQIRYAGSLYSSQQTDAGLSFTEYDEITPGIVRRNHIISENNLPPEVKEAFEYYANQLLRQNLRLPFNEAPDFEVRAFMSADTEQGTKITATIGSTIVDKLSYDQVQDKLGDICELDLKNFFRVAFTSNDGIPRFMQAIYSINGYFSFAFFDPYGSVLDLNIGSQSDDEREERRSIARSYLNLDDQTYLSADPLIKSPNNSLVGLLVFAADNLHYIDINSKEILTGAVCLMADDYCHLLTPYDEESLRIDMQLCGE